jgi:hypothetical protein
MKEVEDMKCPEEGMLQALIDNELTMDERDEILSHLEECEDCRRAYEKLEESNSFAMDKIMLYRDFCSEDSRVPVRPFDKKQLGLMYIFRKGVMPFMVKYKKLGTAACAALLIAVCVFVQPVNAAVSNFLSIFRVENVKGITVTLDDLKQIRDEINAHKSEIDMDKLGRINMQGGQKIWISQSEAKKISDFLHLLTILINILVTRCFD